MIFSIDMAGAHDVARIIIKYVEKIPPPDKYVLLMCVTDSTIFEYIQTLNSIEECKLYAKQMLISNCPTYFPRKGIVVKKPDQLYQVTYSFSKEALLHPSMNYNNYFSYVGCRSEFEIEYPENDQEHLIKFRGLLIEKVTNSY
jgi:hypothetical protein